jgi:hypothetical protein
LPPFPLVILFLVAAIFSPKHSGPKVAINGRPKKERVQTYNFIGSCVTKDLLDDFVAYGVLQPLPEGGGHA